MSTDKDGTQAEEWRKGAETEDDRGNLVWEVWSGGPDDYCVAITYDPENADVIIADHLKAAQADALAAALENVLGDLYISYGVNEAQGACSFEERDTVIAARLVLASYASNPASENAT